MQDKDIILLRQELLATREAIAEMLRTIDERLAALQKDEQSFQIPKSYKDALAVDLRRRG
jgi:hypothetical protein